MLVDAGERIVTVRDADGHHDSVFRERLRLATKEELVALARKALER